MSAFYDLASLVVVPSGYKSGKIYAQKPLTTDGQLAFTRSTTATRVNSAGLIEASAINVPRLDYTNSTCPRLLLEPQRTNLVTYSEQFDNAAWTKSSATVTANTSVSPDGTQNADTVVISSGGYLYREIPGYSVVSGQSAAYSVFAKNQTANFLIFGGATPAGTDVYKIENYGNGWYRHSVVRTFTTTTTGTLQYLIGYEIVGTHIVWGAQIEGSNSAYATSYIPTLGAAVTRSADSALNFSALVNNTSFTLFFEGSYTQADPDYFDLLVGVNQFSGNYFSFYNGFRAIYNVGGGVQTLGPALAPNTVHKLLIKYDGTTAKYYRNGSLFLSIPATGLGTFADGYIYNNDQEGLKVKQLLYFPTALTDAQCIEITTL